LFCLAAPATKHVAWKCSSTRTPTVQNMVIQLPKCGKNNPLLQNTISINIKPSTVLRKHRSSSGVPNYFTISASASLENVKKQFEKICISTN
jgi:hypothetical protein